MAEVTCAFPSNSRALGCQVTICEVVFGNHSHCRTHLLIRFKPSKLIYLSEGFFEVVEVENIGENGTFIPIQNLGIFDLKQVHVFEGLNGSIATLMTPGKHTANLNGQPMNSFFLLRK